MAFHSHKVFYSQWLIENKNVAVYVLNKKVRFYELKMKAHLSKWWITFFPIWLPR